ncbi:MAG TPA: hypothetical protein VF211_09015 [Burkholderiales bacterium]
MAGSTLDPDNIPARRGRKTPKGHDSGTLGPSDTSDSGQDVTGAGRNIDGSEPDVSADSDRSIDRVVGPEEAGLGGGLDQAEEARQRPEKQKR